VFERGAIHRPYFVNRDVALWLHHHMQFPEWSDAAIAAMPETYIREWAAREKVEIDKSYTTEGLESGAHALGPPVPGLTREQLSVFTAGEWPARRTSSFWRAGSRAPLSKWDANRAWPTRASSRLTR